jgi:hypothetical protein
MEKEREKKEKNRNKRPRKGPPTSIYRFFDLGTYLVLGQVGLPRTGDIPTSTSGRRGCQASSQEPSRAAIT